MNKVAILREKVTKLVHMLTEKKVKVTQRGVTASVTCDPKTGKPTVVNLPYIPEDANDQFISAIEGFLDHEVAHVLFSDYDVVRKAESSKVKNLFDMIEDSFIERKMAETFRGSSSNLSSVGEFFLKNFTDRKLAEEPGNERKYLMMPAIRALAGQTVFEDYMKDKWSHLDPVMKKVGDYLKKELPNIASSEDALRVTTETKRLMEEEDVGHGDEEGDEESEEESGDDGRKKPKDKKSKPKDKGSEKGEKEEGDEKDPSDEKSEDDKSEGEDEGESEDGDESEGDDEGDDGEGDGETDSEDSGEKASWSDFEEAASYEAELTKELTKQSAAEIVDAEYKVWSTEFDKIGPVPLDKICRWNDNLLKLMVDKVDHMVGPMQKDLERIIAAKSRANWTAGHRSGRINPGALARLCKFGDERVFRRKHENTTKDVAVSLLIDCSGSMGGEKIETAAYAAYGLSSVLDRIGISHEIMGFTTEGGMPREAHEEARAHGISYARDDILLMPVFKGFGQRLLVNETKQLAGLAEARFMCQNIDGESVAIAATRLSQRKEKRKILIVLSDGYPAGNGSSGLLAGHLKKTVKEIEKSGIDVFAIGIQTEAVKRFYSKFALINDVSELPSVVIGKMKEMLVQ